MRVIRHAVVKKRAHRDPRGLALQLVMPIFVSANHSRRACENELKQNSQLEQRKGGGAVLLDAVSFLLARLTVHYLFLSRLLISFCLGHLALCSCIGGAVAERSSRSSAPSHTSYTESVLMNTYACV